jgi:hypothetical protein
VQKVLPLGKDPRVKLAFLNFLTSSGLIDQAHLVWAKTVEAGTPFPLSSATPYMDQLLGLGRFDETQKVWRGLERLGVVPDLSGEQGNVVFNGDFEETPLNAGFDWRNRPGAYIALDFSDPSAHSGKRCLRIDFTVSRNEEYAPLFQLISVVPKQAYLLTAFVRSQDITSDSGPRLQLVDPVHPNVPHGLTETTTGTTPWHPISLSFCTGPDTRLVQLSIIRLRGRTFPTEITGSFWLDSVVMKPVGFGDSSCPTPER